MGSDVLAWAGPVLAAALAAACGCFPVGLAWPLAAAVRAWLLCVGCSCAALMGFAGGVCLPGCVFCEVRGTPSAVAQRRSICFFLPKLPSSDEPEA